MQTSELPNPLIIDGATGSELDRRGVDTSLPLWSARALIEAPDVLQQIHEEYLRAGAQAITTNTFRTHERSLAHAGMDLRARELTTQAVEIARRARDSMNPHALVLGSVAPLEDCYDPARAPDEATCRTGHGRMIEHLLDAGADFILIETMNHLAEARAAADAARALAPGRWLISFCARSTGEPGVLLSGERIEAAIDDFTGAVAIGVNCVAAPAVEAQVEHLRDVIGARMRLIAYANVGRPDDARGWINTDAVDPDRYAAYAQSWRAAGASIIGGCCGTTPATIAAVLSALSEAPSAR